MMQIGNRNERKGVASIAAGPHEYVHSLIKIEDFHIKRNNSLNKKSWTRKITLGSTTDFMYFFYLLNLISPTGNKRLQKYHLI